VLIKVKFESKKQMAKELMDGKKFIDDSGLEIYYDERYPNPFRCSAEEMSGIWHMYDRDIWMEVDNQRHVHQDLMDSYQDGQSWQYRVDDNTDWVNLFTQFACHQPAWYDDTQYRLHPHNELIQAHRNGAKIQAYICGDWVEESNPDWYEDTQYRIKPATKVVYEWMLKSKFSPKWMIEVLLMSEDEAKDYFSEHEYQKTGRSWEVEE
jgi:hypothetical protein